jgi:hypothetical protein
MRYKIKHKDRVTTSVSITKSGVVKNVDRSYKPPRFRVVFDDGTWNWYDEYELSKARK